MLPDQDASTGQALGQFAQLQTVQNAGIETLQGIGNNYLANQGLDQGEIDIINKDMGAGLAKIPGVGVAASVIKGGFNMLSGRTENRLKNYRASKNKLEADNLSQLNDLSGYAQDAQVTFAMGGDLSMLEGPSHAEGGIQLTQDAEVEGGEVKAGDFILSDRLGVKIKNKYDTFAGHMKEEIKKVRL